MTRLRIGTWNLCLGLTNKKDIVTTTLLSNDIDVCCLQETEIPPDYPTHILNNKHYCVEVERNNGKKRVGIYVKNGLKYKRREDLEDENLHLIIIDLEIKEKVRVINLYRSFRPPDSISPANFFIKQLEAVKRNLTARTLIVGDFNLDAKMKCRLDYTYHNIYNHLSELTVNSNLDQLVTFPTWSRTVKNTLKTSALDHIYTNDTT